MGSFLSGKLPRHFLAAKVLTRAAKFLLGCYASKIGCRSLHWTVFGASCLLVASLNK